MVQFMPSSFRKFNHCTELRFYYIDHTVYWLNTIGLPDSKGSSGQRISIEERSQAYLQGRITLIVQIYIYLRVDRQVKYLGQVSINLKIAI